MIRVLRGVVAVAGSPLVAASLATALLAGGAAAMWWLELPFHRLAESWAIRLFWLALLAAFGVGALGAAAGRRYAPCLLWVGCLLVAFGGGLESGFSFRAAVRLGEGEAPPPWDTVMAGPWVSGNAPEVSYLGAGGDGERVRVLVDGREAEVAKGEVIAVGRGLTLRLTEVSAAPRFTLEDPEGQTVQGYVKLAPGPAEHEFFRVGLLPHRFYLSRTAAGGEEGGAGHGRAAPDELHLKVLRSKLTVLDSHLMKEEVATFEGLAFSYEDGSTWVEAEVRRRPSAHLAGAIALAFLAAGALGVVERRKG